jgi:hypothetical protein
MEAKTGSLVSGEADRHGSAQAIVSSSLAEIVRIVGAVRATGVHSPQCLVGTKLLSTRENSQSLSLGIDQRVVAPGSFVRMGHLVSALVLLDFWVEQGAKDPDIQENIDEERGPLGKTCHGLNQPASQSDPGVVGCVD